MSSLSNDHVDHRMLVCAINATCISLSQRHGVSVKFHHDKDERRAYVQQWLFSRREQGCTISSHGKRNADDMVIQPQCEDDQSGLILLATG